MFRLVTHNLLDCSFDGDIILCVLWPSLCLGCVLGEERSRSSSVLGPPFVKTQIDSALIWPRPLEGTGSPRLNPPVSSLIDLHFCSVTLPG